MSKYVLYVLLGLGALWGASCEDPYECPEVNKYYSPIDPDELAYVPRYKNMKLTYRVEKNGRIDTIVYTGLEWEVDTDVTLESPNEECDQWDREYRREYLSTQLASSQGSVPVFWQKEFLDMSFDGIPFEWIFYKWGFDDEDYQFTWGSYLDTMAVGDSMVEKVVIFKTYYHQGEMLYIIFSKDVGFIKIEGVVDGELRRYQLLKIG